MLIARLALTVGNLERLAALTPQLAAAGCATRLALAGDVAELCVTGTCEALDRAAELLRREAVSNVDRIRVATV